MKIFSWSIFTILPVNLKAGKSSTLIETPVYLSLSIRNTTTSQTIIFATQKFIKNSYTGRQDLQTNLV